MQRAVSLLSLLLCLLFFTSQAATYYVNSTVGNDGNNGLSPSTPWQSISKVNSRLFEPGDEILFKRDSKWFEILVVSSSGTEEFPVKYSAYGTGASPVIDGDNHRSNCIIIHSKNNVIIENFSLMNTTGDGALRIMWSFKITASNNEVFTTAKGGIFIENSSYCNLSDNTITTPSGEYDQQTDGIYSQRNANNIYERNKIIISNSHPLQHIDGIQSYIDESLIIRNNYIFQNTDKTNSQGIYSTFGSGTHLFYNNVVDCPNTVSAVVGFSSPAEQVYLILNHNTLIGRGANIINVSGNPVFTIKNNIFLALSSNHSVINIDSTNPGTIIDYNLYFNGGTPDIIVLAGVKMNMEEWNLLGFDLNSIISDPLLEDDYTLRVVSPAVDIGTDSGELYRYDKAGILRPQFYGFDIGAYECVFRIGENENEIVHSIDLFQNYPNPFNPTTYIKYSLTQAADVIIRVYDAFGQEVMLLLDEYKNSGEYIVELNAAGLASGVYFYRLETSNFIKTRKLLVLK